MVLISVLLCCLCSITVGAEAIEKTLTGGVIAPQVLNAYSPEFDKVVETTYGEYTCEHGRTARFKWYHVTRDRDVIASPYFDISGTQTCTDVSRQVAYREGAVSGNCHPVDWDYYEKSYQVGYLPLCHCQAEVWKLNDSYHAWVTPKDPIPWTGTGIVPGETGYIWTFKNWLLPAGGTIYASNKVTINGGQYTGSPALSSMNITVNKGVITDTEGTSVFTLGEDSDAQVTTLL